jgi:hypothetical protein
MQHLDDIMIFLNSVYLLLFTMAILSYSDEVRCCNKESILAIIAPEAVTGAEVLSLRIFGL